MQTQLVAVKEHCRIHTTEPLVGDSVRHRTTMHENPAMGIRDQLRSRRAEGLASAAKPREALPHEVQEALVLDA